MKKGDLIRPRVIVNGVRLGKSLPKRIVVAGRDHVTYDTWAVDGTLLRQTTVSRAAFDQDFEVVPEEGDGMARFIVTVRYGSTGEDEELRVEAEDWVLAAFKAGLCIAADGELDQGAAIRSIERVTETRTEEWSA